MTDLTWRKSSYSGTGNCLQVKHTAKHVLIRDTTDPDKILTVTRTDWNAFVAGAKAGEFDT